MKQPIDLSSILAKGSHSFREANRAVLGQQRPPVATATPPEALKPVKSKGNGGLWADKVMASPPVCVPRPDLSDTQAAFLDYLEGNGLPLPIAEYRFAAPRRWRADFCWLDERLILEVQGGIWTQGRHTRGAALLSEWEKLNTAAGMGYRFLFCQPSTLCTQATVDAIRAALRWASHKIESPEEPNPESP